MLDVLFTYDYPFLKPAPAIAIISTLNIFEKESPFSLHATLVRS